jgi:hypothetical protein
MPDEPDALLLRRFAESRRPLMDARFVAEVSARLPAYSVRHALGAGLSAVLFGIVRPLRLRHAGIVALGALGMVVFSVVMSAL